jgi:hypothetical protein
VSVDFDSSKQRWRVRWREGGRQRSKRFRLEQDAVTFDASLREGPPSPEPAPLPPRTQAGGDGVYAYDTKAGVRYRFMYRQSDGSLNSRRGYRTSCPAIKDTTSRPKRCRTTNATASTSP